MKSDPAFEVFSDLEFSYPETPNCRYVVPKGTLLRRGEAACILGVSGSGKSTAMTLLAALRPFSRGQIEYRLGSDEPTEVEASSWDRQVGPALWGQIGFAFQKPELIRSLTVAGNLALVGLGDSKPPFFEDEEWASIAKARIWKLSGGQIQRLGLLRAFGTDPELVFLDEPTNNLDRANRDEVAAFVSSQRSERALVVVSHDERFIQALQFDRLFAIEERAQGNLQLRTLVPVMRSATAEDADRLAVPMCSPHILEEGAPCL